MHCSPACRSDKGYQPEVKMSSIPRIVAIALSSLVLIGGLFAVLLGAYPSVFGLPPLSSPWVPIVLGGSASLTALTIILGSLFYKHSKLETSHVHMPTQESPPPTPKGENKEVLKVESAVPRSPEKTQKSDKQLHDLAALEMAREILTHQSQLGEWVASSLTAENSSALTNFLGFYAHYFEQSECKCSPAAQDELICLFIHSLRQKYPELLKQALETMRTNNLFIAFLFALNVEELQTYVFASQDLAKRMKYLAWSFFACESQRVLPSGVTSQFIFQSIAGAVKRDHQESSAQKALFDYTQSLRQKILDGANGLESKLKFYERLLSYCEKHLTGVSQQTKSYIDHQRLAQFANQTSWNS